MSHPADSFIFDSHPADSFIYSGRESLLGTARGRAQFEQESIQEMLDRLIKLRERVTSPEQASRLDRLIQHYTTVKVGGPKEAAKGIAAGVAGVAPGTLDMLLALGPSQISDVAKRGRRGLQEWEALIREGLEIGEPTIAGTIGEITGGVVAGAPVYGGAARATAKAITKAVPAARPILLGATEGSAAKRAAAAAAANVAAGLPINVAVAASSEAPLQDRIKQMAIQTGADALFGIAHKPTAAQAATRAAALEVEPKPAAAPLGEELVKKFQVLEAKKAELRRQREQAKAEWIVANKDKEWSSLKKEEKLQVYNEYVKRVTAAAAPPVAGMTSEESAAMMAELASKEAAKPPLKIGPETVETSYEALTGEPRPTELPLQEKMVRTLSDDDLQKVLEAVHDQMDPLAFDSPEYIKLQPKVDLLFNEKIRRAKEEARVGDEKLREVKERVRRAMEEAGIQPKPVAPKVQPQELAKLPEAFDPSKTRVSPTKLSTGQLDAQIEHSSSRLSEARNLQDVAAERAYQGRLSELMNERTRRDKPPEPLTANVPVGLAGALLGLGYGVTTGDPGDEAFLRRLFYYTMAGGFGASLGKVGVNYLSALRQFRRSSPELFQQEARLRSNTIVDTRKAPQSVATVINRIQNAAVTGYTQIVNRASGAERIAQAFPKLAQAPAERSFAKQMFTAGRWVGRTEAALVNGVTWEDAAGNSVVLSEPLNAVFGVVRGDIDGLDRVALALASAELSARGRKNVPMDQAKREAYIRNAPPEYLDAAKRLRAYNLALMKVLHMSGRLSDAGYAAMSAEEWYTPVIEAARNVSTPKRAMFRTLAQPRVVYPRKVEGAVGEFLSPSQLTIELTARVMRAAEQGRALNALADFAESQPALIRNAIMTETAHVANPEHLKIVAESEKLSKAFGMSKNDAQSLVALLDTVNMEAPLGKIIFWRNGELRSYKVSSDLFQAVQSMTPIEWDWTRNQVAKVSQFASRGVVYDPWFILTQLGIDGMASFMQSKWGMNPLTDGLRAVIASAWRTGEYKSLIAAGGPATWQSMQFTNPKFAAQATRRAGETVFKTALRDMKEFSPIEAYKALVVPFAETWRVAEYLAARRHGASVMEATYAAWDILGNTRMEGSSQLIRALNMGAMFTRPSISALDKTLKEVGLHPLRVPERAHTAIGAAMERAGVPARMAAMVTVVTKGIAAITIPTMVYWSLTKDDEEIRRLKQTKIGARYWFLRDPISNDVFRIKKPHIYGELLGTFVERALDEAYQKDPQQVKQIVDALAMDASVNVIPLAVQIPISIAANRDFFTDRPVVPEREAGLEPALAGASQASPLGQAVAKQLSPFSEKSTDQFARVAMSPAGIDYILGTAGGMIGQDILRAVASAKQWAVDHQMPPKQEMPIISRAFVRYPSQSTGPIQLFYDYAKKIDEVAQTLNYYERRDPKRLGDYVATNKQWIILTDVYNSARRDIADLRRAVEDIRNIPADILLPDRRRRYIDQYTEAILQRADMANKVAKRILSR